MKKHIKSTNYVILLFILFLAVSCSDDESAPTLELSDFNINVDENLEVGIVLGSVIATGNDGILNYRISNPTIPGAIAIDTSTGEITVQNTRSFDYETNPTIAATVNVTGNSITKTANITISLNDIDDIESILSDSKLIYKTANDGDWILITQNEYEMLASNLNLVSKIATTDADYDFIKNNTGTSAINSTWANNNNVVMPSGSYVFAYKHSLKNDDDSSTIYKVKQSSTSASNGYADLGGNLPTGVAGDNYFVLKASSNPTTNIGYLAFYESSNNVAFKDFQAQGNLYYFDSAGDVNDLTGEGTSATLMYQGLSTTQKQW